MGNFVMPVRVYYEDTDAGGVVYYANYLHYLERARTEWLRTLGVSQAQLCAESGLAFAVRALEVGYLKPARLEDELQVVSTIASHGRAQVLFDQRILREEQVLLSARVRVACLDLHRGRAVAMPQDLYEQFSLICESRNEH